MSRYLSRKKAINDKEQYDKLFEKRGVRKIVQYRSPSANFTTDKDLDSISCHQIVWTTGMSFEKLAERYYGDFNQWWIIAGFNKAPTESHVKNGDIIRIPKDIADGLSGWIMAELKRTSLIEI